jgi:hypothetical protein
MLCLSCQRMSPSSARYCGHCGRSFRGRYCRHGHQSPRWARRCIECGEGHLTPPTPYIPTGWLTRGLSWLLILLVLRLLWAHPDPALRAGAGLFRRFGFAPQVAAHAIERTVVWIAVFLVGLSLMPERFSRPFSRIAFWSARAFLRSASALLSQAWQGLRHLAGGP